MFAVLGLGQSQLRTTHGVVCLPLILSLGGCQLCDSRDVDLWILQRRSVCSFADDEGGVVIRGCERTYMGRDP